MSKIKKAIFPVAGLGTRFLPATKTIPKEMLTIVDKPVIQYVIDEAQEAGIEHFIFVTGRNKAVIEDYFDIQVELYTVLKSRGKEEELEYLNQLQPQPGSTAFTRQQHPLGLGHAVWCARELVGNEPFAVLLPDMIMKGKKNCLREMIELYEAVNGGNITSVQACAPEQTKNYGIVALGESCAQGVEILDMVEKPDISTAPSNFYMNGRYILQPEIFSFLSEQKQGLGGEIQLTDAMLKLLTLQKFHAYPFEGRTFDCGSKLGFLAANLAFALDHPQLGKDARNMIKQIA